MGCHTWFGSDFKKYSKALELDLKFELERSNDVFLEMEIDDLYEFGVDTEYHDIFRTNSQMLHYTDMVLKSEKETIDFINKYKNQLTFTSTYKEAIIEVKEFWNKYPNGVIHFG